MPRSKRLRKILEPPQFGGFTPYNTKNTSKRHVVLFYEEYEAFKLADYKYMKHQEAAKVMNISRATFARIYESARRKIAKAMAEVQEIRTDFGNAKLDGKWYICNDCYNRFAITQTNTSEHCPDCQKPGVEAIN
jgi:predicted DNA-binding protein (UPF0251 family)